MLAAVIAVVSLGTLAGLLQSSPASAAITTGPCVVAQEQSAIYYRKTCLKDPSTKLDSYSSYAQTVSGTRVREAGETGAGDTTRYTYSLGGVGKISWCTVSWNGSCVLGSDHNGETAVTSYKQADVDTEIARQREQAGSSKMGEALASSIPAEIKDAYRTKFCAALADTGDSWARGSCTDEVVNNAWKTALGQCDTNAKSAAASWERRGSEGWKEKAAEAYKGNFALCLANKTGLTQDYIKNKLPNDLYDKRNKAEQEGRDSVADPTAGTTEEAEEPPSCGTLVDGIGWFVCPVLDGIAGLNDAMWNMVSALLTVDPLTTKDESGATNPFYTLWSTFRTLANIVFVIAFLFMIYSQLTSFGLDNRGVKKLLPKLILVAIAVNMSWVIVSLLVDVFNILGTSIYAILKGSMYDDVASEVSWVGLVGIIVGVGAAGALTIAGIAIAGGVGAVLLLLLPLALMAMLGVVAALLTLMVRQAAIPLLAVLAPLAIVATLLPGTENLFKKWRGLFISMLSLFPIAALLFGGLQVAGKAIAGSGEWFSVVTALIVMSAPLFMLPYLATKAGPMLGALNGKMRGLADKARAPMGKWAGDRAKLAGARYDMRTPGRFNLAGRTRQGFRRRAAARQRETSLLNSAEEAAADAAFASRTVTDPRLSGVQQQTMTNKTAANATNAAHQANFTQQLLATNGGNLAGALGDAAGNEAVGRAVAASVAKATQDAIKEAELSISSHSVAQLESALANAMRDGDSVGARAAQNRLFASGSAGIGGYRNVMAASEASANPAVRDALKQNVLENHGGIKDAAMDIMQHASDSGNRSLSAVSADKDTWKMSDADFAKQKTSSQKLAMASGAVEQTQAKRIKDDSRFSGHLDEDVRVQIDHLAK